MMTDNELKELVAGLAVSNAELTLKFRETEALFAKTDAQMARTEAQMARTDAQIAKSEAKLERMGISLGNIADNNGMTTEEYFYNALYDNPVMGGIRYDEVKKNIHSYNKRLEDEYDIVLYNGDSVALIECKYKAHENDLRKLMDKKVTNFRLLFPDYADYKIYLGLASYSFYPELEQLAKEKGVAILKRKGELVEIEAENLKVY